MMFFGNHQFIDGAITNNPTPKMVTHKNKMAQNFPIADYLLIARC